MLSSCSSKTLLKKVGVERTVYRDAVLKALRCSGKAMTPQHILAKVRKTYPIDKVTLYRILDLFVGRKLLRRLTSTHGALRYEVICEKHNPAHAHFACRSCGEMECLSDFSLDALKKDILSRRKTFHEDMDLKIEGLCQLCESKRN